MPEEHLKVKMPETTGEKSARKEQALTDEQEGDRGILPKTLRNILIITGALLVVSAAIYLVILRGPFTGDDKAPEIVAPEPTPVEGETPVAAREGRIGRILGAEDSKDIRALVEMRVDDLETFRPVGVIPHPYLQKRSGGYSAVVTRELVAGKTVFRVSAILPQIDESQAYHIYIGHESTARELGALVHMGKGVYVLITSEKGFNIEPFVYVTGPDPKKPEETVTILSGIFQTT